MVTLEESKRKTKFNGDEWNSQLDKLLCWTEGASMSDVISSTKGQITCSKVQNLIFNIHHGTQCFRTVVEMAMRSCFVMVGRVVDWRRVHPVTK